MGIFSGKTAFITGASRGIGKAIALKLAAEGASIVIAAKSVTENPRLGGTIYSAAAEIETLGARALAVPCDIRSDEEIIEAVSRAKEAFGGIDILINNASAITLAGTENIQRKHLNLLASINVEGTFMVTKHSLPFLRESKGAHVVTLSPPIDLKGPWIGQFPAYTLSKYAMSMLTLGWAKEFAPWNIAVNSVWPATTIATAAVKNLLGGDQLIQRSRKPEIVADAVAFLLQKEAGYTGNLLTDEEILADAGITNLEHYAVNPGGELQRDLFL